MEKPKRWTFEQYMKEQGIKDCCESSIFVDLFFATDPLLDWQEERIAILKTALEEIMNCHEEHYFIAETALREAFGEE